MTSRGGEEEVGLRIHRDGLPSMAQERVALSANFSALLEEARPRLLRLARLNGITADLAEDVVQDTCLEAWRHLGQLQAPDRFASWLDGICRNVCRRQASALASRAQRAYLGTSGSDADEVGADLAGVHLGDPLAVDPGEELDRQDRQLLVDRALGHLSASARELIELCYLVELPQREVAERLDMSLGALELRLHRARRRLRQVLSGALRADAEEFGLLLRQDEATGWRETRKWCPLCGKHRLRATFDHSHSGAVALRLRCPVCSARHGFDLSGTGDIISFAGMRSLLPAIKRGMRAACDHFSTAVHQRACARCRSPVRVQLITRHPIEVAPVLMPLPVPTPSSVLHERSCLLVACPRCGYSSGDLVNGLLLEPAARAFLLDRPHVIIEPDILASYAELDAIRSRLVDLNTTESLAIMAHPQTLQIMATLQR